MRLCESDCGVSAGVACLFARQSCAGDGLVVCLTSRPERLWAERRCCDRRVAVSVRQQWLLLSPVTAAPVGSRGVGMLVARIVRGVLKIRYLLIGGTLAGGYSIQKVRNRMFIL